MKSALDIATHTLALLSNVVMAKIATVRLQASSHRSERQYPPSNPQKLHNFFIFASCLDTGRDPCGSDARGLTRNGMIYR